MSEPVNVDRDKLASSETDAGEQGATGDDKNSITNTTNAAKEANQEGDRNSANKLQSGELGAEFKRKGSTVSFKEKCDLYEVDLSRAVSRSASNSAQPPIKPSFFKSLRYFVILLALTSPFIVTYSRTIINFAITDMIAVKEPYSITETTSLTTTSLPPNATSIESTMYTSNDAVESVDDRDSFDLDNSCPVDSETRARLHQEINTDRRKARENIGEKFDWDAEKQGLLKGSYSIGHALLQVAGGRFSEIYGSHWIMSISAFLLGICCLAAPFLASLSFYLMVIDLILMGILGSFMSPALITLFSNWLTPSEKTMMVSFYLVSSRLGYALSSLLCGLLIDADLSWRYLFYSAGWTSLGFTFIFMICARSRPQDHPIINELELNYLASKNRLVRESLSKQHQESKKSIEIELADDKSKLAIKNCKSPEEEDSSNERSADRAINAPWLAILTNRAVWAFIVTKFCVKFAGDTVQTELPTYLKRVLHIAPRYNGYINSANYVIFCISCLLVAAVAKMANKKHPFGLSKTGVRKLFQCTASFSVAILLFAVAMNVCNNVTTVVLLMIFFFMTTLGTGGEAQIPLDISERYSGTIHAIGSSLAISNAIEPIVVGFWLNKSGGVANKDSWANVWLAASTIAALGGMVFLIFGDATIQPFDNIGQSSDSNEPKPELTIKVEEKEKQNVGVDNKAFESEDIAPESSQAPHRESVQI